MSEIYSGAAGFGRTIAIISAIFFTVIGIGLIVFGIYLLLSKSNDDQSSSSRKGTGIISIIFGALFIIIPWVWVLLTQESKFIAAIGGVGEGVNIIRSF